MAKTAMKQEGWRDVSLILEHTDRSLLAADLSDILETLGLEEWREVWHFEHDIWQVKVTNAWSKDA